MTSASTDTLWTFDPDLAMTFSGTTLDTANGETSAEGVSQDEKVTIIEPPEQYLGETLLLQ
ncbi:hypothetical protein [endosymbiont of Lamellibrachia barhami]|uniref:hypothetical protein n=1 Tax=endosymbiont of Lamellibrachia barhami TaxID=205975 RepID=UPI0015A80082|nr:hypothetical protein [endosymbiont of Lamellibrachia barhami]